MVDLPATGEHIELGSTEFWQQLVDSPAKLATQICLIDVANLDRTLEQHAALRAWVAATFEVERLYEERLEWDLTKARAIATVRLRQQKDSDGKAKTVQVLEAEVAQDTAVEDAQQALFFQQEKVAALRAVDKALGDRKDMLVQIAAKQRREHEDYR